MTGRRGGRSRAGLFTLERGPMPVDFEGTLADDQRVVDEYEQAARDRLAAAGYPVDFSTPLVRFPDGTWRPLSPAERAFTLEERVTWYHSNDWIAGTSFCNLHGLLAADLGEGYQLDPLYRCAEILKHAQLLRAALAAGDAGGAFSEAMRLQQQWDRLTFAQWEWFARVGQAQMSNGHRRAIDDAIKAEWLRLARAYMDRHPRRRVPMLELARHVKAAGSSAHLATIRAHLTRSLRKG